MVDKAQPRLYHTSHDGNHTTVKFINMTSLSQTLLASSQPYNKILWLTFEEMNKFNETIGKHIPDRLLIACLFWHAWILTVPWTSKGHIFGLHALSNILLAEFCKWPANTSRITITQILISAQEHNTRVQRIKHFHTPWLAVILTFIKYISLIQYEWECNPIC